MEHGLAFLEHGGNAFLRIGAGRDARQGQRLVCELHLGQPDDLPGAILFFASDDAAYITGQVLSVSGGLTMAGR